MSMSDLLGPVMAIIPLHTPAQHLYLCYRASGFSIREALALSDMSLRTLHRWRTEEQFSRDEAEIPAKRKELSKELASLEFTRNLLMALRYDAGILRRAVAGASLSRDEQSYLRQIRGLYTPQQWQALESLFAGQAEIPDFISLVRSIQKRQITITEVQVQESVPTQEINYAPRNVSSQDSSPASVIPTEHQEGSVFEDWPTGDEETE